MLKKFICFLMILVFSIGAFATTPNFVCPKPSEIRSTDFTSPSIWVAPAVPGAVPDSIGVGLGGKQVRELLGVEEAEVNHQRGWVCVYRSKGGLAVNDYETKILETVISNPFLKKYLDRVSKAFQDAEPYLKNYPKDTPIGFVGYQMAKENNLAKHKGKVW